MVRKETKQTKKTVEKVSKKNVKKRATKVKPDVKTPPVFPEISSKEVVLKSSPNKETQETLGMLKQFHDSKSAPHAQIQAYAGTGKTFSLIVGVVKTLAPNAWKTFCSHLGTEPIPSTEQKAIWDRMNESLGIRSVTYCAFNKSIVNEFSEKWGWAVQLLSQHNVNLKFSTVNSLGNSVLTEHFGRGLKLDKFFIQDLACDVLGMPESMVNDKYPSLLSQIRSLSDLIKLTMVGWTKEHGFDAHNITQEDLDELAAKFDLELGYPDVLLPTLREAMNRCVNVQDNMVVDFNDQNWIPVVKSLPVSKADLLLVDEGQDLPRCKQEFALRAGKRIFIVGDSRQAIYGFAGADVESMPRMQKLLSVEKPLKLTETRRCSKAVVEEARKIVPDFRAHESNKEGSVKTVTMNAYVPLVKEGDMCLCRVNAPLIGQALKFLKMGKKAVVRGKNFGAQLATFIEKLSKHSDTPENLIKAVEAWAETERKRESAKKRPSEGKLSIIEDKKDCVISFTKECSTTKDILTKIRSIFSGKECPRCRGRYDEEILECFKCKCPLVEPKGIMFSSVHKAKGLEANNVFILIPRGAGMPHPMAKSKWQLEQEMNLKYVAITRAIENLTWVTDSSAPLSKEEEDD